MCNFGVTEMPDQRIPQQAVALTEQVFSEDRMQRMAYLEEQAKIAAVNAKAAMEAKQKKRKIAEAFKAKKEQDQKKKKKHVPHQLGRK